MGNINILSSSLPQLPPAFDATPLSLIEEAKAFIDHTRTVWDKVALKVQPNDATFENTIIPIITDENQKYIRLRILRFYSSTSPSKELRDASNSATSMFNDADVELYSRVDIYHLVSAVLNGIHQEREDLDDESIYYVEKLHRTLRQNGCGITDVRKKQAFEQAQKRIQGLVTQCTSNLHEDSSGIWLSIEELEGVPEKILAQLKQGEADHEGQVWVKTKVPHPFKIISHAKSEDTRRKVYYAMKNRLPQNIPLFRELVLRRDEVARLLEYPNYLAYKTADKMARTPEKVVTILDEIRQRIRPHAVKAADELLDHKSKDAIARGETAEDQKLFFWDESFYAGRILQNESKIRSTISEYFELYHTLDKLLELLGHIFDTRFELITPEQQSVLGNGKPLVWHSDVSMYAVWDTRKLGEFLGYAYFDFFPREGKYGHGGSYATQWGFTKPDGRRFYPSCALVMNYTKLDSRPVLLSLVDVRKLFHELGHLHHSLCTKVKYASLSYIDRDFVEAPSLMFEQFFWEARHIKDLSYHYSYLSPEYKSAWLRENKSKEEQPPRQLSDKDVAELATQDPKKFISRENHNLFLSYFDILVHTPATHEELEQANLAEMFNRLQTDILAMHGGEAIGDGWDWSHGESVFRMIVSGYDAGYYTYVLGRVFALNMWNREFKANTLDKDAAKRFRDTVFCVGGKQPEEKTLKDYLGHEPSTDPYFKWLNI
ncbi:peptidase family M3 [Trichoderma harzianum]|uniref:Peptidase family M3 n=1 Tax=Trichoderma harzianum TaxID=5544 RepID=A0A0G0ACM2_TRIHA|nr:peptidase family M3 [Trichoderma harzianum]